MDNGHFSVSRITKSHISSTPLYGHWVFLHCYLYMALIVNIVSCSSNERFLRVSTILLESQRQAANVNLYHLNKFPIFWSFTVHYNYTEIISFMPALSMRIALSRFY